MTSLEEKKAVLIVLQVIGGTVTSLERMTQRSIVVVVGPHLTGVAIGQTNTWE